MEYHSDRFTDYSLLVFKEENLMAVLPANRIENKVISHQGLTYGGLVLNEQAKLSDTIACFKSILLYLEANQVETLDVKLLPSIYASLPSSELEYLMFKLNASLYRSDVTTSIEYSNRLEIVSSNRKRSLKRAAKHNIEVKQTRSFDAFWNAILQPNLKKRYQVVPTHSLSEITRLAENFPDNIKQFNAYKDDKIVAGVTIFETPLVAHAQYISANEDKQELGSLDALFDYLIDHYASHKKYFDFGISNENQGHNINQGLLSWKESFGARTIVQPCYRIESKNSHLLNEIMI